MPTREETTCSWVNWAVYCKPICTDSQRKGIQRILSKAKEEEGFRNQGGFTVVEQDRVRTLICMTKARKYDAAKDFLQKMLQKFPGTGEEGLWSLHGVSVDAHKDAQSSTFAAPKIDPPSFLPPPALALKCALLSRGPAPPQSLYHCFQKFQYSLNCLGN
jgi:hypothetical protein